jgi:hypothetical protein
MSGNFQERELETTSRPLDGIAYGRGVRILARQGDKLLLWVPGQGVWSGTGQPWRYEPGALYFHDQGDYKRLAGGGGGLQAHLRVLETRSRIDALFGEGFHQLISPRKTIIIGGEE